MANTTSSALTGVPVNANNSWIIDSGASAHMTYTRALFTKYTRIQSFGVELGDKHKALAVGKGTVALDLWVKGRTVKCILTNVLHVPELGYNLISVSAMDEKGTTTSFNNGQCTITNNGRLLAQGFRNKRLYLLSLAQTDHTIATAAIANAASLQLWHARLGHVHAEGIKRMSTMGIVKGIKLTTTTIPKVCEPCVKGKIHRSPIPKYSDSRATGLLDLVHSDVCDIKIPSLGDSRYLLTFVDDHSRWSTVFFLKNKCECYSKFLEFQRTAERETGRKVRILRSDRGGEYLASYFQQHVKKHGIQHQLTVAYTPQQNGVAERLNRTLVELVRSMLHHKHLENKFWAEALSTACYIRNRVTTRGIPTTNTPYELWKGVKPDLSLLRVFGSRCWYATPKHKVHKLDSRANDAIMMGYAANTKAYRLWDTAKHKMVISRDVVFDELDDSRNSVDCADTIPIKITDLVGEDESRADVEGEMDSADSQIDVTSPPHQPPSTEQGGETHGSHFNTDDGEAIPCDHNNGPRRSARIRKVPQEWWKATAALVFGCAPSTFLEATNGTESHSWMTAMENEMRSLYKNDTWTLVPRNHASNILTPKWVYRKKEVTNHDGSPAVKFKARLCARGFQQVQGIDYNETFAPVVTFTSIRILLATVAA